MPFPDRSKRLLASLRDGHINRRDFLRTIALFGGAITLSDVACGGEDTPEATSTATPRPTSTALPTLTPAPTAYRIVWPEDGKGAYVGFFDRGWMAKTYLDVFGAPPALVMDYQEIDGVSIGASQIAERGVVPLVTVEPRKEHLEDIASGKHDDLLRRMARSVGEVSAPVVLRPMSEMNGNWDPWQGQPGLFIEAWRRIRRTCDEEEVRNVTWLWTPSEDSQPREAWNQPENYYPGDEFVDVIGVDGYNWGSKGWGWRTFDQCFRPSYDRLTSQFDKPFFIGEFSCSEHGGSKADWIRDAFESMKSSYPKLKGFVWFNVNLEEEGDWFESDFRFESSPEARDAFVAALQDPYFLKTVEFTTST